MKPLRFATLVAVAAFGLTVICSARHEGYKIDDDSNRNNESGTEDSESTHPYGDNNAERYGVIEGGGGSWGLTDNSDATNNPTVPDVVSTDIIIPEHNYVGAQICGRGVCHGREEIGNQFGVWEGTAHSRAYEALASPEAQAIAAERGIGNPQESGECLPCHTTAYGIPDDYLEEGFDRTLGVQCESCHGPGADYKPMRIMRDRGLAIANGLIIPDESVCVGCHNENSPNFDGFDYQESLELILHLVPDAHE